MPSATLQMIEKAIAQRDFIEAGYHGYQRRFAPHCVGFSKDGEEMALMYQFGGQSESGLAPAGSPKNWRCVRVAELTGVHIVSSNGAWHTASGHSKSQTCVSRVVAEVRY